MPGFIDLVIDAGKALGVTYKIVEVLRKLHEDKAYSKRDRLIIEAARSEYKKFFSDRNYPLELSYYHEIVSDSEKVGYDPEKHSGSIHDGKYRPPRVLSPSYVLNSTTMGRNDLSILCKNAVLSIYGYLNALNLASQGMANKTSFVHYGHTSDATRFLFHLLANGLIELSKVDLNDPSTQKEAERYIDFLMALQKNKDFDTAFQDITAVTVGKASRAKNKKPLALISTVCTALKKISKSIVLHRSKSSILEHTITLNNHVQALIDKGFIFSLYIMSDATIDTADGCIESWFDDNCFLIKMDSISDDFLAKTFRDNRKTAYILSGSTVYYINRSGKKMVFEVDEDDIIGLFPDKDKESKKATKEDLVKIRELTNYTPPYDGPLNNLISFRNYLSDILHFSDTNTAMFPTAKPTTIGDVSSKEDIRELYNKTKIFLKSNALKDSGINGVYAGMQPHISAYIEYCTSLILLAKLRLILPYLIQILRAGGDIFAVIKMKKYLVFILSMMQDFIDRMQSSQQLLAAAADVHFTQLNESGSTKRGNRWKSNQMKLYASLPPEVLNDTTGVNEPMANILNIIRAWSENPKAKITELRDAWNIVLSILADISLDVRANKPAFFKEFKGLISGTYRDLFATFPSFDLLADDSVALHKLISEESNVSITIEEIKTLLTDYALKYGYQLPLSYVAESIRYSNLDGSTIGFVKKSNEKHIHRARWMNQAFILLFATQSEKDILNNLLVHMQELVPSNGKAPEMMMRGESAKGMKHCISEIQEKAVARLRMIQSEEEADALFVEEVDDVDEAEDEDVCAGAGSGRVDAESSPMDYVEKRRPYSDLVAELKTRVDACLGTSRASLRNQAKFLDDGWNALCFLKRPQTLRAYHHSLYDVHSLRGTHAFLKDLHDHVSGEDEYYRGWGVKAASSLAKTPLTTESTKTWVTTERRRMASQLTAAERLAEKRAPFFPVSAYDLPGHSFFKQLSLRILQKQERETVEQKAARANEDKQFDAYLIEIFNCHQRSDSAEERAFCLKIARGLMILGANPLQWMITQEQTSSEKVGAEIASAYFLAAEQTALILSHLQYRASRLSDCATFFGPQLDVLFTTFNNFADKLTKCVEADNHFLWKGLGKMFHYQRPDGARLHRAALLWCGLRYIYTLLNDNLFEFETPTYDAEAIATSKHERSDVFSQASRELERALSEHRIVASRHSKIINTGITTAGEFGKALAVVNNKVAADFATQRQLHASAESAKKAKESAERIMREKLVLAEQNHDLTQKADASDRRADASDRRADSSDRRADASDRRADAVTAGYSQFLSQYLIRKLQKNINDIVSKPDAEIRKWFETIIINTRELNESNSLEMIRLMALDTIQETATLAILRPVMARLFPTPAAIAPPPLPHGGLASALSRHGTFTSPARRSDGPAHSFAGAYVGGPR